MKTNAKPRPFLRRLRALCHHPKLIVLDDGTGVCIGCELVISPAAMAKARVAS